MAQAAFYDAITAASDELSIEVATTPEQVLEAKRLRYQVTVRSAASNPARTASSRMPTTTSPATFSSAAA